VLHQQAGEELVDNLLGGAGEEALGEVLGRGGGYGSGFTYVSPRKKRNSL